jgi:SAM-dependent methyltransferase
MLGLRETFAYAQCQDCGSLALTTPPGDMVPYYRDGYYSLTKADGPRRPDPARTARRVALLLGVPSTRLYRGTLPSWAAWLSGVWQWQRILDFGGGNGTLVNALRRDGYLRALAVDPYADSPGVCAEIPPHALYDFVMFNHALEHVSDPRATLAEIVAKHLTRRGRVMIRIPLADSWAFEHYGSMWVQIDAPRHMFVPTQQGIRDLAAACGLTVTRTIFDSGPLQFWGSDRYVAGETLGRPPDDLDDLVRRANALNAEQRGDQAIFFLTRSQH